MSQEIEKPLDSLVQLINFRLGKEEFGVDICSVREITRVEGITHIPEAPSFIRGVINLRGKIIGVIDLAWQFGLETKGNATDRARIVVTKINTQTVGILVDEVPGVLKIPEGNIKPTPELITSRVKKDYIKGVGKLGKKLIILLDLEKVLSPPEVEEVAGIVKE